MKQWGENNEADNYLVRARIIDRISNARKENEDCVKKFNFDRLKEEEIKTSYVERLRVTFSRSHGKWDCSWEYVKTIIFERVQEEQKEKNMNIGLMKNFNKSQQPNT
jgi:hypothetical protein